VQLFSAKQIQNLESETIKSGHISNYNLMIKASTLFANWVDKKLLRDNMPIAILCGHGNNGGDGYAIAQILRERKSPVVCYDLSFDNEFSTLCKRTKSEFEGKIIEVSKLEDLHELSSYALVLDAILGIGCSRAFDKNVLPFIQYINNEAKHIMSVDIPSGMLADMKTDHDTILAQETLTFSAPKLAFFSSTNAERLGKWVYRDISVMF